jgi:hypothetical protein
VIEQPYVYRRTGLAEPDWTRFPGWAGVTRDEWESATCPYVGKRWVHQVSRYDTRLGISYRTKNYRTGVEANDPLALSREYAYYDPIYALPAEGQRWWRDRSRDEAKAGLAPAG